LKKKRINMTLYMNVVNSIGVLKRELPREAYASDWHEGTNGSLGKRIT
jgi:hypothetical protein